MTRDELIALCKFYHGENFCPEAFDGKLEGKLWQIEKNLCEDILFDYQLQGGETPREVFDSYVEAMVGKWCPYQYNELMNLYFER